MQVLSFGQRPRQARPVQSAAVTMASPEDSSLNAAPTSDLLQFGSKAKLQQYAQAQKDIRARQMRDRLAEECIPAVPGAEAITYLDILEAIREYQEEQGKNLTQVFKIDPLLKSLGLSTDDPATSKYVQQLKTAIAEDLKRLDAIKDEYSGGGYSGSAYNYKLKDDAIAALELSKKASNPSATESSPGDEPAADGKSML